MGQFSLLVKSALLAVVGHTVFKGFFHRTVHAFLISSLIRTKTVIPGNRVKFFGKLPIIPDKSVISVLNSHNAGNQFKQILIFISLLVQLTLLFANFPAHPVDGRGQLSQFISLLHFRINGIFTFGD